MKQIKIIILLLMIGAVSAYAWKEPKSSGRSDRIDFRVDCAPGQSVAELDVNNVRARLNQSGSLFVSNRTGRYIVPKVDPSTGAQEVSSLYSGAVWIGGLQNNNFKVAAVQSELSSGNTDWYPGPLDASGEISQSTCSAWDKHFVVQGTEITAFRRLYDANGAVSQSEVPVSILGWPAKGNRFFSQVHGFSLPANNEPLAGFKDQNFDGVYDPLGGDFPIIEIRDCDTNDPPIPDQMHFWIFNDNGDFHAESNGIPIRMEVQVQTFAFTTNDAINNMTFYRNKMINRAASNIDSMYFANWADPDLGCSEDDYIGCDTLESLAFLYNADATDGINGCECTTTSGSTPTYCNDVPMLGIDYFRGPLTPDIIVIDTIIHIDSTESGTDLVRIKECREIMGSDTTVLCNVCYNIELGMSSFVYHARQSVEPGQEDPDVAAQYYSYLSGSWKDGTRITHGGTGYNPGSTDYTRYVFPSSPNDMSNGAWSMTHINDSGDQFPLTADPRLLQASGPFVLEPGKINELIVGVVWVPNIPDYPAPSLQPLLEADVAAQGLFDNCFNILDGPQAPDMCVIELDQELILTLSNPECSNNFLEAYSEKDFFAPEDIIDPDRTKYLFEGYTIYQLADENVGVSELEDSDRARLLAQVDVTNGISSIYNWSIVEHPRDGQSGVFVPVLQVEGDDSGTRHSFQVTQDLFASGNNTLINHKKYFYMVLSYAHNNYDEFDITTGQGQKNLYLTGRQSSCGKEIQTYTGIPRPIISDDLASKYGDGAIITRVEGHGAGGRFLRIDPSQQDAIFDGTLDGKVTYLPGAAPIQVSVFNPLAVKDGKYSIRFTDSDIPDNALIDGEWELYSDDDIVTPVATSDFSVDQFNEQLVADLGISISIGQTNDAGDRIIVNGDLQDESGDDNGLLGLELEYTTTNGTPWFDSYEDEFAPMVFPFLSEQWNYIKTRIDEVDEESDYDNTSYSNFGDGLFYPYTIISNSNASDYQGPGWQGGTNSTTARANNTIESLNNVDVVMTSDKSKWSRCVVLETASRLTATNNFSISADAGNMELSPNPSVGKNDNDGDGFADEDGEGRHGMGWFPGYAYDVETGERLNILFGENSAYSPDKLVLDDLVTSALTGDDMMLNPTPFDILPIELDEIDDIFETGLYSAGSGHMIYVTNEKYDSCNTIWTDIESGRGLSLRNTFVKFKWASFLRTTRFMDPLNGSDEPGLIPEDLIVRLRCDNSYDYSDTALGENFGYPHYEFELKGLEKMPKEYPGEASVLDNIMAVPNPYYGFSAYETGILDNRIKITNLPDKATITIYSLNGKFIRQYDRNEDPQIVTDPTAPLQTKQVVPDLDWDLENFAGIPVSSGVYIIHVAAPGIGEKVIKWFGIQREFNPSGL